MLFSKPIKLDKDYQVKIGIKEIISMEQQGIDVYTLNTRTGTFEDIIKTLDIALKRNKDYKLSLDELIDFIDESETITFKYISTIIDECITLGLMKENTETKNLETQTVKK
jgi:hypothetical protein